MRINGEIHTWSSTSPFYDVHLREAVKARIEELLKRFPSTHDAVKTELRIRFKKRGNTAGTANYWKKDLNFNMALLRKYPKHFITQTVGHEVAHLVARHLGGRKPHGKMWKDVMRSMGLPPNRCHNYDTTDAGGYSKTKYNYECAKGHLVILGPTRHKRQQAHVKRTGGRSLYYCKRCRGAIAYKGVAGKVTYKEAREDYESNR